MAKKFSISVKKILSDKFNILLAATILSGLFLRLYQIYDLFYYTMDEEVMNLIQRRVDLGQHFPLIGSVSPLGTYLGPIFYYFGAVILWISKLDPIGLGVFGCLLGAFNIFLIYRVAKEMFDKRVGLFSAVFYAFSFLMVIFDRRYWHLTPGPLLSLIVLWSVYKIKQGKIKFIYLLTAVLIFGWNTDYTNLVLFLFTFLAWIFFKLPVRRKEVVVAILIFLVSNLPLVAFDIKHNFLNTRSFISYFSKHKNTSQISEGVQMTDRETLGATRQEQALLTGTLPLITFSRAIFTLSNLNITDQHTYCKDYILDRNRAQGLILPIGALIIILAFLYLTVKAKKDKRLSYQLILSFYLIFQLGVLGYAFVFKGDVFEHYLATLLPYLFIMLGVLVGFLYKTKFKYLGLVLVFGFIIINISLVFRAYNPFGYNNKTQATKFALSQVGQSDFSLDSLGSCFRYDGYYYPFVLMGRHPVKSYQDPNYSWLYDYQVAEKHPSKVVVMVSQGKHETAEFFETYQRYQQWVVNRAKFGGIEVLILDNSKGEFN